MRVVAVVLGHHTHYQVVDAEGYPLAQGSLALCQAALVPPPDPDPEGIDDHEEPDYTDDDWAEYDDDA